MLARTKEGGRGMRTPVKCNNCGIKWVRVIAWGDSLELTEDLQYNCPNCNSNDYDARSDQSI